MSHSEALTPDAGLFKCTVTKCDLQFRTLKEMQKHRQHADGHYYCSKCEEAYEDIDDFEEHRAFRPETHPRACRVCGDEFQSDAGLKRHIEVKHPVNQRVPCGGCGQIFSRAAFMIEHIEFGNCKAFNRVELEGAIVHKQLINELLTNPAAQARWEQKMARTNLTQVEGDNNNQQTGGISINLLDQDKDEAVTEARFAAIEPETRPTPASERLDLFPRLQAPANKPEDVSKVTKALANTSLTPNRGSIPAEDAHNSKNNTNQAPGPQIKAWGTKTTKELFPHAKPSDATALATYCPPVVEDKTANVLTKRHWDPLCKDFDHKMFWDVMASEFFCPFYCDQTFSHDTLLSHHILLMHRYVAVRCPRCNSKYSRITSLIAHMESRGHNCTISRAEDFRPLLDTLTGGFLSVSGEKTVPELGARQTIYLPAGRDGTIKPYKQPAVEFLEFEGATPAAWGGQGGGEA